MSEHAIAGAVRKRHVFFLSGFDPKGASYYHGVYASEAAKRAAVGDIDLAVSGRQRGEAGNTIWTIRHQPAATPEEPTDTVYEYLRWDDIVRTHWPRSLPRLLVDTFFGFRVFTPCGAIRRMHEMAPATGRAGVVMGLVFPVSLLASVVLALLIGWLTAVLGAGAITGTAIGLVVLVAGVYAANTVERRFSPSWMSRIIAFVAKLSHGRVKEMDGRLDAMSEHVAQRLRDPDIDEVLVVGYSVGSILAVSVVTRALRLGDAEACPHRATLSLLTIGHCIPMLALLPRAETYRAELAEIASHPGLTWCDFSAPGDWGSFAMVDPIGACRISVAHPQPARPQLRSPRFHTMFAPAAYDELKRDKRRLHLQYLMAGDLSAEYDYFAITAGPLTLARRYPVEAPAP